VWRRQSRQDRVELYESGRSHEQVFSVGKPSLDFRGGTQVVLVPTADRSHHATSVGEEARHANLACGCSLVREGSANVFDSLRGQWIEVNVRNRHDKSPLTTYSHRKGGWLDLNSAVVPAHLERDTGSQSRLAADFSWDDQSSGGIDGCSHTIKHTIKCGTDFRPG
jgi:hypothetical protein